LSEFSFDRAFGFQMPRRAFWPPGFSIWDQAGFAMKVTVERAQLLKSLAMCIA